jgi:CRISPR system Cascade subunit CasE
MTFLSRLRLHPRDLLVISDLADITGLHRTLMRAFPQHNGGAARVEFGVLFRLEPRSDPPIALVQSNVQPEWAQLPEGYVLAHESKEIDALLEQVRDGHRLRFYLVANPSRKTRIAEDHEPAPRNSRRVALATDAGRHAWLVRRGELGGFSLSGVGPGDGVRILALPPLAGRTGQTARVYVRPVLFEGALIVTDQDLFHKALRDGIGPAKAYGCGLLSIGPAG